MDKTGLIITTAKDIMIAYNKDIYTDPKKFKDVVSLVNDAVESVSGSKLEAASKK